MMIKDDQDSQRIAVLESRLRSLEADCLKARSSLRILTGSLMGFVVLVGVSVGCARWLPISLGHLHVARLDVVARDGSGLTEVTPTGVRLYGANGTVKAGMLATSDGAAIHVTGGRYLARLAAGSAWSKVDALSIEDTPRVQLRADDDVSGITVVGPPPTAPRVGERLPVAGRRGTLLLYSDAHGDTAITATDAFGGSARVSAKPTLALFQADAFLWRAPTGRDELQIVDWGTCESLAPDGSPEMTHHRRVES